jgi:hypothetical protein
MARHRAAGDAGRYQQIPVELPTSFEASDRPRGDSPFSHARSRLPFNPFDCRSSRDEPSTTAADSAELSMLKSGIDKGSRRSREIANLLRSVEPRGVKHPPSDPSSVGAGTNTEGRHRLGVCVRQSPTAGPSLGRRRRPGSRRGVTPRERGGRIVQRRYGGRREVGRAPRSSVPRKQRELPETFCRRTTRSGFRHIS